MGGLHAATSAGNVPRRLNIAQRRVSDDWAGGWRPTASRGIHRHAVATPRNMDPYGLLSCSAGLRRRSRWPCDPRGIVRGDGIAVFLLPLASRRAESPFRPAIEARRRFIAAFHPLRRGRAAGYRLLRLRARRASSRMPPRFAARHRALPPICPRSGTLVTTGPARAPVLSFDDSSSLAQPPPERSKHRCRGPAVLILHLRTHRRSQGRDCARTGFSSRHPCPA